MDVQNNKNQQDSIINNTEDAYYHLMIKYKKVKKDLKETSDKYIIEQLQHLVNNMVHHILGIRIVNSKKPYFYVIYAEIIQENKCKTPEQYFVIPDHEDLGYLLTNQEDRNWLFREKYHQNYQFCSSQIEISFQLIQAKEQILIAMYHFNHFEIWDTLLLCLVKGVKVKLILGEDLVEECYVKKLAFEKYFPDNFYIKFITPQNCLMHTKFCVVDSYLAIEGSVNWTAQGLEDHYECFNIFYDEIIIESLQNQWQQIDKERIYSQKLQNANP